MDEPELAANQSAEAICPACGASNEPAAKKCWICYTLLPEATGTDKPVPPIRKPVPQMQVHRRPPGAGRSSFVVLIVLGVVMITVGAGCFAQSILLGILYLIVAVPGLIVGLLTAGMARARNADPPTAAIASFALTSLMMIPVAILVGMAAMLFLIYSVIAAFFQACGELFSAAS